MVCGRVQTLGQSECSVLIISIGFVSEEVSNTFMECREERIKVERS